MASSVLVRDDFMRPREAWTTADTTRRCARVLVDAAGTCRNDEPQSNVIWSPTRRGCPEDVLLERRKCPVDYTTELQRSQSLEVMLDGSSDARSNGKDKCLSKDKGLDMKLKMKFCGLDAVQKAASTECLVTAKTGGNNGVDAFVDQTKLAKEVETVEMHAQSSESQLSSDLSQLKRKLPDPDSVSGKSTTTSPLASFCPQKTTCIQPTAEENEQVCGNQMTDQTVSEMGSRSQTGNFSTTPQGSTNVKKTIKKIKTVKVVKRIRVPKSRLYSNDPGMNEKKTGNTKAVTENMHSKHVISKMGSQTGIPIKTSNSSCRDSGKKDETVGDQSTEVVARQRQRQIIGLDRRGSRTGITGKDLGHSDAAAKGTSSASSQSTRKQCEKVENSKTLTESKKTKNVVSRRSQVGSGEKESEQADHGTILSLHSKIAQKKYQNAAIDVGQGKSIPTSKGTNWRKQCQVENVVERTGSAFKIDSAQNCKKSLAGSSNDGLHGKVKREVKKTSSIHAVPTVSPHSEAIVAIENACKVSCENCSSVPHLKSVTKTKYVKNPSGVLRSVRSATSSADVSKSSSSHEQQLTELVPTLKVASGKEYESKLPSSSMTTKSRLLVNKALVDAGKRSGNQQSKELAKSFNSTHVDTASRVVKSTAIKQSSLVTTKPKQVLMHTSSTSRGKHPLQKRHTVGSLEKSSDHAAGGVARKSSCPASPMRRLLRTRQSCDSLSSQKLVGGTPGGYSKSVASSLKGAVARVDSGLRVKPKVPQSIPSLSLSSMSNKKKSNVDGDISLTVSAVHFDGVNVEETSKSAFTSDFEAKSKSPGSVRAIEQRKSEVPEESSPMELTDTDLQHVRDSVESPKLHSFGRHRTIVKPQHRRRPSINPVKQLQSRSDVVSELKGTNLNEIDDKTKSVTVTKNTADNQKTILHESAKAGLASTENFKSVVLRKTRKAPDGTAMAEDDENYVMSRPSLVVAQIKGRRRIQVHLVEPSVKSLNSGDVFVIFTSTDLYQWVGSEANAFEKAKGTDLATRIMQKKDMGCKARHVSLVEQRVGFSGTRLKDMLKLLGSDSGVRLKSTSEVTSDEDHEKKCIRNVMIYSVKVDHEELIPLREMCGKQPKFAMLNTNEVFVFDFYTELYVWIGLVSLGSLRRQGVTLAKKLFDGGYVSSQSEDSGGPSSYTFSRRRSSKPDLVQKSKSGCKRRPNWALFSKLAEGAETFLFKEKFADWPEPGRIIKMKGHVSSGEVIEAPPPVELIPCDVEVMRKRPLPPEDCILEGDNLGRGQGVSSTSDKHGISVITTSLKVYHIKEYDYFELDADEVGLFYSAEGYVVCWKYRVYKEPPKRMVGRSRRHQTIHEFGGRERCCYFFWQGDECTVTEKGAAAIITVELDEEKSPQVRVPQGKEPPVFLQLFGGGLVVLAGKRAEINNKSCGTLLNRLFYMRGESAQEALLEEITTRSARSLRSQGCFVVLSAHAQCVFVWKGCRSSDATHGVAMSAAQKLKRLKCVGVSENFELVKVNEGEERMRFWRSIGGKYDYYSLLDEPVFEAGSMRLFQLSSATGKFTAQEVLCPSRASDGSCTFPFLQSDIYSVQQPAVFLLEACGVVYLWFGWWPTESEDGMTAKVTGTALSRWLQDKMLALKTAESYARAISRRCRAFVVVAGFEPNQFTNIFPKWQLCSEIRKCAAHTFNHCCELLKVEDELMKFHKKYSIHELRSEPLPDNVDPIRLETYLTAADFETVFKITRDQFSKLPKWKQTDAKKMVGLF